MPNHVPPPLLENLRRVLGELEAEPGPMSSEKTELIRYLRERIAVNDPSPMPLKIRETKSD